MRKKKRRKILTAREHILNAIESLERVFSEYTYAPKPISTYGRRIRSEALRIQTDLKRLYDYIEEASKPIWERKE